MQYNAGAQLDPSQMGGGGGGGGKVAVGGGVSIIVVILAMLFGINPAEILGGAGGAQQGTGSSGFENCRTGADIQQDRKCRFVAYTNATNEYWAEAMGSSYKPAQTIVFSGQTPTGCGTASTDVGPFYCPNDQKVYFDPTFFDSALIRQLGAKGGDAAEAYVVAHEYGHHIQNLRGILAQVQQAGDQTGPNSPQVALELQADCYGGVALRHMTELPNSPIAQIDQDDLNRAQNAAQTVGDDYIQKRSGGGVQPDSWTHGSSVQRQHWLAQGYNSGDPNVCDDVFKGVR